MRSSRPTISLAILLFLSAIGADDCVLTQIGKPVPPPPSPSSKPFCTTDPPLGCTAVCTDVDVLDFNPACHKVEAGPREMAFEQTLNAKVDALLQQDQHVCNPSTINVTITPCQAGFTPVEWPNQDHEVCMTAPPGCPL